jgi:hypothetical protein
MVEKNDNARTWPSWSWSALVLRTEIATVVKCGRPSLFNTPQPTTVEVQ